LFRKNNEKIGLQTSSVNHPTPVRVSEVITRTYRTVTWGSVQALCIQTTECELLFFAPARLFLYKKHNIVPILETKDLCPCKTTVVRL